MTHKRPSDEVTARPQGSVRGEGTMQDTTEGTLIALDPSITCTGAARFENGELAECYMIRPPKTRKGQAILSHERIAEIIGKLHLHFDHIHAEFVIEITSGKTARRLGKNVQGLATYGMAVGQVVQWAIQNAAPGGVHQVYENEWTRSSGKSRRQEHCRYAYPLYAKEYAAIDTGGDIADAIMLGDYWINNRAIREASA